MKPTKEIAQAYNLSPNSVKKWSVAKRERASKLIERKVNPVAMQLVGELQALVYAAQAKGETYIVYALGNEVSGTLLIHKMQDGAIKDVFPLTRPTVENLRNAINVMEGIIYA